jgi:hypothetical protein
MSTRPNSRALGGAYAARIAALTALGIELRTIAAEAEVSASTFRRVRGGQPVVRATARSIELSVDLLIARHAPTPAP